MSRRSTLTAAVLVFVVGVLYDTGWQNLMRPYAKDGLYFQAWSSEDMMQTVSIRDLRIEPVRTLLNIHIQPPAFDAIRALLVQLWPSLDLFDLLRRVDASLYLLGALLLGLLAVVIFLWTSRQCGLVTGTVSGLVFLLHPASIFFATFLDSTFLSAVLIAWSYYLLWKIKNGYQTSIVWFSILTLSLFFTRSIFQLPYVILLAVCLGLLGVPRRGLVTFLLLAVLVSGLYTAKQWFQFRMVSTSSLVGVNLANSVGVGMGTARYAAYLKDPQNLKVTDGGLPDVLVSTTKLNGQPNFNNINYLNLDNDLFRRFLKRLSTASAGDLAGSYADNLAIYFEPSSFYSSGHVIVERLPWRGLYDAVFSAPILPVLLVIGLTVWVGRLIGSRQYAKGAALIAPGLFVLLASVLLDKGENMRFKFFLEPVMFVFLVSQFHFLVRAAYVRLRERQVAA